MLKISVVISTFNEAPAIGEVIGSVPQNRIQENSPNEYTPQMLPGLRNPLEPLKLTIIRFEDRMNENFNHRFGGGKE